MIDVNEFLQTTVSTPTSTTTLAVPEGEYLGQIEKLDLRSVKLKDGTERSILRCVWTIVDEDGSVRRATNRDKNTVNQDIWLDFKTNAQGKEVLDDGDGMNVKLGQLREALGQNSPGVEWGPSLLIGVPARILVTHRAGRDNVFAEVRQVRSLS